MFEHLDFKEISNILSKVLLEDEKYAPSREEYSNNLNYAISCIIVNILNGSKRIKKENIDILTDSLLEDYREIVRYRWEGIIKYFNNDYDKSISLFEKALNEAENRNLDKWIIRDIILDLRNIEREKRLRSGILFSEFKKSYYQDKLGLMRDLNFFPLLDKNLIEGYINFEKSLFADYTSGPIYGFKNYIFEILEDICKALIIAIHYGSYTFISFIRLRLGYIFYNFYKMFKNRKLLITSLKMFIIEYSITEIRDILKSDWEDIYKEIIDKPMDLIDFPIRYSNEIEDKNIKCMFIEKFAFYLDDDYLPDIQKFLMNCLYIKFSLNIIFDTKRNSIRALSKLINRLDINLIMKYLIKLFNEDFRVVDEIIELLDEVNWKIVDIELIKSLLENLYLIRKDFPRKDRVYIILSEIRKEYPHLLEEKENEFLKEWSETRDLNITLYFSLIDSDLYKDKYNNFVLDLIQNIENKNDKITKKSPIRIIEHLNLFHLISNFVYKYNFNISKKIYDKLFISFKKVLLNVFQTANNKREFIELMIRVCKCNKNKLLKKSISNFIKENYENIIECRHGIDFFEGLIERLKLKLYELYLYCNNKLDDLDSIFAKCVEYGNHNISFVRNDSLSVIEALIELKLKFYFKNILQYLYSNTFDKWYIIRANSIILLSKISRLDNIWELICLERMKNLLADFNSYVRSAVIYAAGKNLKDEVKFKDDYISILKTGLRDHNYELRKQAEKILNELGIE
jgi:hypothetical protein